MEERIESEKIVDSEKKDAVSSLDTFWKVVVVALLVVVVFQAALLYKTRNAPQPNVSDIRDASGKKELRQQPVLRPRNAPRAKVKSPYSSSSACPGTCALTPPPLPHLNVNVNPKGGSAPVISMSPQQPRQQRQMPSYQSFASQQPGGMSIHISQFPSTPFGSSFGPSFGMDIQQEIARMERMMNAMMNSPMMGFGPNSAHFPLSSRNTTFRGSGGGGSFSYSISSPSIKEDKDNYIVRIKIPGLDKTQVDAKVEGQMLSISGTKREETKRQGRGFQSYSSSLSSFHNSFPLPGPVKAGGLKVEYDKDTLTVTIPKAK